MTPFILLTFIIGYFLFLFCLSYFTTSKVKGENSNLAFFNAQKNANWIFVSIGMIGTTLSGVTFISVPGTVQDNQHSYFQFILGNALGFLCIALFLLPIFYKHQVVSIYEYLKDRFDERCQKWASIYFIISRLLGSGLRFFLAMIVLQKFIFDAWNIPFFLTAFFCMLMIWLYTHRGGLKTIVVTDLFQTLFIVLSVCFSIYAIADILHLRIDEAILSIWNNSNSQIFFWDNIGSNTKHFYKLFLGGFFITVCMVGLDQDIMQKNLSVKTYKYSRKNMLVFTGIFLIVNLFFLYLGSMLYVYADNFNVDFGNNSDYLFPTILLEHFTSFASIMFMLGLTSATFATTDSAITALTTSCCVDILEYKKKGSVFLPKIRQRVHAGFCLLIALLSIILYEINNEQIVYLLFRVASYTYGPLLGLFAFGLFTKKKYKGQYVFISTISAPVLCYIIAYILEYLNIYIIGFELILYNGFLCFLFLWVASSLPEKKNTSFVC